MSQPNFWAWPVRRHFDFNSDEVLAVIFRRPLEEPDVNIVSLLSVEFTEIIHITAFLNSQKDRWGEDTQILPSPYNVELSIWIVEFWCPSCKLFEIIGLSKRKNVQTCWYCCYLTLIFLSYISNFIYLFRAFNSLNISKLTECMYNGKIKHEIQSKTLSRKTKTTNWKG